MDSVDLDAFDFLVGAIAAVLDKREWSGTAVNAATQLKNISLMV